MSSMMRGSRAAEMEPIESSVFGKLKTRGIKQHVVKALRKSGLSFKDFLEETNKDLALATGLPESTVDTFRPDLLEILQAQKPLMRAEKQLEQLAKVAGNKPAKKNQAGSTSVFEAEIHGLTKRMEAVEEQASTYSNWMKAADSRLDTVECQLQICLACLEKLGM